VYMQLVLMGLQYLVREGTVERGEAVCADGRAGCHRTGAVRRCVVWPGRHTGAMRSYRSSLTASLHRSAV
jgi:hypothetical protein